MNWKFWEKDKSTVSSGEVNVERLHKPRDLPPQIGQHLVAQLKQEPDWVWSLKCALRKRPETKHVFDFRVFNEFKARDMKVSVKNFNSLDDHRELILFEGWLDKSSNQYLVKDNRNEGGEVKAAA